MKKLLPFSLLALVLVVSPCEAASPSQALEQGETIYTPSSSSPSTCWTTGGMARQPSIYAVLACGFIVVLISRNWRQGA